MMVTEQIENLYSYYKIATFCQVNLADVVYDYMQNC